MFYGFQIMLSDYIILSLLGTLVVGAMFVHGVELQHQTLHYTAFRSRRLTEVAGIILGLPMLVSFAGYQASHMRHHRDLGTHANSEFFNYGDQYGAGTLSIVKSALLRFTMIAHYRSAISAVYRAVFGLSFTEERASVGQRMRRDYLIMIGTLGVLVTLCLITHSLTALRLWLLPLLLVAGPLHALVEMPEHYHCNTNSREVFENTRTIRANGFLTWFTNGNNFHVEHHLLPTVGVERLQELHERIAPDITHLHTTYYAFFREAIGFRRASAPPNSRPDSYYADAVERNTGDVAMFHHV
jgi:fatty acid desaturase